jgi:hypothetical protein
MKRETPDQKWNRLQSLVQVGIEKAYPNPERTGCPKDGAIAELARRSAQSITASRKILGGYMSHIVRSATPNIWSISEIADQGERRPRAAGQSLFSCISPAH